MSCTRMEPLTPPFEPKVANSLAKMMGGRDVEPLALFRTLLHNFEAGDRIRPLGSYLLTHGQLLARERELVILRVCARAACEYEWGVHVSQFSRDAGLSEEEIEGTVLSLPCDPRWGDRERTLIAIADELHNWGHVTDHTWMQLRAGWSEAQILELLMLAGWYHMIAYVANGTHVALEPWAPRFPRAA